MPGTDVLLASYAAPLQIRGEKNDGTDFHDRVSVSTMLKPSSHVMMTDATGYYTRHANMTNWKLISPIFGHAMDWDRHRASINVLYFDGHCRSVSDEEAQTNLVMWGDDLTY